MTLPQKEPQCWFKPVSFGLSKEMCPGGEGVGRVLSVGDEEGKGWGGMGRVGPG